MNTNRTRKWQTAIAEWRFNLFKDYIETNKGRDIAFAELQKLGDFEPALKINQIEHTLLQIRAERDFRRMHISKKGGGRVRLPARLTQFDIRSGAEVAVKGQIGNSLFHFMLGKPSIDPVSYFAPPRRLWPVRLQDRIDQLRTKSTMTILMDSGTTTREVANTLFDSEFPIPLPGSRKDQPRMLFPTIITNSPYIALDAIKSSSLREQNPIDIRLIGGSVRPGYASICGPLSEACLAAWAINGSLVGYDLAIIGCTGFLRDHFGEYSLGVDHLDEAVIKGRLLSASAMRSVVVDSSKLDKEENQKGKDRDRVPGVPSVFCPLSGNHLDVLVTDDRSCHSAAKLAWRAFQAGVIPVIVSTGSSFQAEMTKVAKDDHGELPLELIHCSK